VLQKPASSWRASCSPGCGMAGAVACIFLFNLVQDHHRQQQRQI
jgi:hypothetical protein